MRKFLMCLTACIAGLGHIAHAQSDLRSLRIGESNPSISAYVFGSGEQISGQQFQTEGLMTYAGYQYTVYYNLTRNVCIARRKMPLGNWQEIALPYKNSADDAHNTISMGICAKDGSIHLSYDHHNDALHYCYSVAGSANDPDNMPWEATSFSATTDVMDLAVPNVTYPRFISKPDGNLLFECRFNWSGHGDSYLREYDGETKKWTLIGRYVQGEDVQPDACAYINGMTYDHLGRLHVTWCWRDDYGGETNHDFYYGYSEDHGRTWKDTNGEHKATTDHMQPIFDSETGNCMGQTKKSFMVETIPYNRGYINQETQAVDSKGRIHAVNSHIPDGESSDSNWASSRLKARLHHRFRDTDGTWKKIQIKNNGVPVHSYCRVNLLFDAFDNAYVIANGAEIYYATAANNYEDWDLLTNTDTGRFLSEPLTDRSLLKNEGILSFVYLGADHKITVIDYLLDNPNTPSGTGLTATYFAETDYSGFLGQAKTARLHNVSLPEDTKSVRWTGTFETSFAEEYTLYLNTTAATTVYVDGVKVLLTRKTQEAKEYSFNYQAIPSHKHTLVIEAEASPEDFFSLSWSSPQVEKELIPATALYPDYAHEIPVKENPEAPELTKKTTLEQTLYGESTLTGKELISLLPFNPAGNYSLEVKAQILSSADCGLHLEARTRSGKGFRITLNETSLHWSAPLSNPTLLAVADHAEAHTYRLAVKGNTVHIYQGETFLASADITEIGDLTEEGEERKLTPLTEDYNLEWAGPGNSGTGTPADYGWENTLPGTPWNVANNNSGGVRYLDVTADHTYNNSVYKGRIMTIRWDGNYGTYSFPVELEGNTTYEFSMLYEWWNNGSPTSITAGISTTKSGSAILANASFPTSSRNVLQKGSFLFTTEQAGMYYLVFNGQSGVMYGIAELALTTHSYEPQLTLTRHCDTEADIRILHVTYEDEAYAPGDEVPEEELEIKEFLAETIAENISVSGLEGSKDIRVFECDPSGDYSVEIAALIPSGSSGRGMDFEVRDQGGFGFRTAMNDTELSWMAPFSEAQKLAASNDTEQIIRYAVKGEKVSVFQNGVFLRSLAIQSIGDLNDEGTKEERVYSGTAVQSASNRIVNPDFQGTADNGAPEGWTSNGSLGISGGARVQLKSSTTELSAYPEGTKAFLIRFDGSYTWFSNRVVLQPDTWYEFSFDLIAWGDHADKTLQLMVSTAEGGEGDLIHSETLTTPSARATGEKQIIRFKTGETATSYFLTLAKGGSLAGTAGITDLCLIEYPVNRLLVGKNYTEGFAGIQIRSITYDGTGAFAPVSSPQPPVSIVTPENKDEVIDVQVYEGLLTVVSSESMQAVQIYDISGRKVSGSVTSGLSASFPLEKGLYIVEVYTESNGRFTGKVRIP